MRFGSESEAKQFFVQRVLAQAAAEGIHLSDAERHVLNWSESDPHFRNPELAAAFEALMPEEEFEARVSGLLERAYTREIAIEPAMKTVFKEAYAKLAEGDHYLLVMIERALGRHLKRWWWF